MAKFDIQYADRPVNIRATGAYARPQTEVYEAISRAGQSMFQIGSELQQRKEALEISEGQRKIAEQYNAAIDSLTGDEEKDAQIWERFQQGVGEIQYSSNRVNEALTIYRNRVIPDIQNNLNKRHEDLLRRNIRDQFEVEGQTYLVRGDLENYQDILDRRFATQDISKTEYDALSRSAFVDSLLEQSRDAIATGTPESNLAAMKMLDIVPSLSTATTEKKEYAQKLKSLAKRNGNTLAEEANKQLTDLMIQGSLSSQDVLMRRNSLNDQDYQSWAKIAIQPFDKPGNVIQETEFKTKSIDVWRGTLSRTELEGMIRDSLASPTGINDKQYAAIYDDLNREVKAQQAQDMKTYSIEATRLILGKDAGVMSFDALGNMTIDINKLLSPQAEFERKMHFVDLYNKQMSDFLAENPKASKKEMYVVSQELKATYLAASKGQTGIAPQPVRITTDEEWLQLEDGQHFIGPDGIERIK